MRLIKLCSSRYPSWFYVYKNKSSAHVAFVLDDVKLLILSIYTNMVFGMLYVFLNVLFRCQRLLIAQPNPPNGLGSGPIIGPKQYEYANLS